jgi:hypothetical protein
MGETLLEDTEKDGRVILTDVEEMSCENEEMFRTD